MQSDPLHNDKIKYHILQKNTFSITVYVHRRSLLTGHACKFLCWFRTLSCSRLIDRSDSITQDTVVQHEHFYFIYIRLNTNFESDKCSESLEGS